MKITLKADVTDPVYPIMHGKTPLAKEFNKRQAALWGSGVGKFDFEQVTTVLLEIFADDYNEKRKPRATKKAT